MKTLTEFATPTLKNALAKKQELTASGKTAEELPAAMGEALTLEGDKLAFLLAALELVGEKMVDLKRVVVATIAEGEKAPSSARLIGDKYYTADYYVQAPRAGQEKHDPRDRGGRDGKGKKGGGRGGDRGGKGEGRGAGGGGGRGPGAGAPRGAKPPGQTGGTGRLPVPNKTGGLPTPAASKETEST